MVPVVARQSLPDHLLFIFPHHIIQGSGDVQVRIGILKLSQLFAEILRKDSAVQNLFLPVGRILRKVRDPEALAVF